MSPKTLIALIETDVAAIVDSGILAHDLEAAASRGPNAPPKLKRTLKEAIASDSPGQFLVGISRSSGISG